MKRGVLVGEVWGTRKSPSLTGRKLVFVAVQEGGRHTGEILVAIDTLDANVGQEVLVAFGSGARNVMTAGPDNLGVLADAAVCEIIDGSSDKGEE